MKFVVVDDDAMDRVLIQEFLSIRGYVVVTCDGPAALEVVAREKPNLVLLDVRMAPLSGVEVARRIRAMGLDTCVVLMSGIRHEQITELDGVDIESLGVVGFLEKAWLTKSLQTQLHKFLRTYKQRKAKEAAG